MFFVCFSIPSLIFLLTLCDCAKVDVELINETIRSLLHFRDVQPNDTFSFHRPTHNLMEHMRDLYEIFNDEDGNEDGNLVRAIEPAIGKIDGQEVLVFNIDGLETNEAIMRGELHFYLRRRDPFARRRSRHIRAKSLCINEYCREQSLRRIRSSTDQHDEYKVVWDATKPVFDSFHLNAKQLVFRINREHTKMRAYSEMIRKSTPFLIIYSKANHTLDTATVLEQSRRRRRDLNRQYYTYKSIPLDEEDGETIGGRRSSRKYGGSEEMSAEDVWQGFGEETSREERERLEDQKLENDVRVVLLQNINQCHKQGTLVSLKYFGWDKWIIEPKSIETSFCKGKCSKPLSKKASNHAMLQSLFAPEPVCCAPNNLKSLNLLYRDEKGRTVIRNYSRMLIGSCSCL